MFNVHVLVIDAKTKQPAPCRLRIADAAGRVHSPLGRVAEFAVGRNEDIGGQVLLNGQRWYYINGACEVRLPAEVPLIVEITKGPEYKPIHREITLGAGQMALRFELERWIDLRAEDWYSGSDVVSQTYQVSNRKLCNHTQMFYHKNRIVNVSCKQTYCAVVAES